MLISLQSAVAITALTGASALAPQEGDAPQTERDAYTVEAYTMPDGCVLEVGGMDFLPDGRLVVSTRRGQVWMIENPLADDISEAKVTLYHEGLWEGLGLNVKDGAIYVVQRGEVSRLDDTDGDGRCDDVITIADDWGVSGHYHEFAFGLPRDSKNNWWVGLNVSFGDPEWWHGRSTAPNRGWIMRVGPDGNVTPWAHGVRSPNGVAVDSKDRVFVTDNQGDWVASSPIYRIVEGGFYGHPKSLNWTDDYRATGKVAHDEIPPAEAALERQAPVVWIPYEWSRSTGNLLEDRSGGKFGVPKGQFVVAELTNGMILRAGFEDVQGVTQGWITPLVQKIGSVNRVLQAPDGTVLCGLTNRGWGGLAPADGLMRVRWNGKAAMEIKSMSIADAKDDEGAYGFTLSFSEPLASDWTPSAETIGMIQYDYDYWWEYGSPERHTETLELVEHELSEDRKSLVCRFDGMLPAMCVRLTLDGVKGENGGSLLHPTISYTINQLPSGPKTNAYVAKVVPPPPSKGDVDAGVLRLSWGDALGQFDAEGWELCDAQLDPANPAKYVISKGNSALVNTGAAASDFRTRASFGDAFVSLEFMLPKDGKAMLHLNDVAAIELSDDPARCGAIGDALPTAASYGSPGEWYPMEIYFRTATETSPASVDRVVINGVTVQEGIEVSGTSGDRGPLWISGAPGGIAIRNVQVKPLDRPSEVGEWTFLDPVEDWDDWTLTGDASFELNGEELIGTGALGHLWAPVEEVLDFTLRAQAKVNANGAGAIVLRAKEGSEGVDGYAVRINTSFPDDALTGSIRSGDDAVPIRTELIASDTWVDVEIDVRNGDDGAKIRVLLNGIVVNEFVDPTPLPAGGIAFRCDHEGTVFKVQKIRIQR